MWIRRGCSCQHRQGRSDACTDYDPVKAGSGKAGALIFPEAQEAATVVSDGLSLSLRGKRFASSLAKCLLHVFPVPLLLYPSLVWN